jgi:hypothetical protein
MSFTSFSQWLEDFTQPQSPYYHPLQLTLLSGLSYASTACLTSISPVRGMNLINLIYMINQVTTPIFIQFSENQQDVTLIPLSVQVANIGASALIAKLICSLAGQKISIKEMMFVGGAFVITLYGSRFALLKLRQELLDV